MVLGTGPGRIPVKLAFRFPDRQIVNAGVPMVHQPVLVELPVLVTVGAKPVARGIMRFVSEAHGDTISIVRP